MAYYACSHKVYRELIASIRFGHTPYARREMRTLELNVMPGCVLDEDCAVFGNDITCVEGTCAQHHDQTGACLTDANCPLGSICSSRGACVQSVHRDNKNNQGVCASEADCQQNQVCRDGICAFTKTQGTCVTASDCGEGERCTDGWCIAGNARKPVPWWAWMIIGFFVLFALLGLAVMVSHRFFST